MTTPKHTPGPWIYRKELGSPWPTLHGKTSSAWIAQIPDSTSADARLIASAPALLAALESCLPDLAHYVSTHGPGPDKRLEQARAAIALAKGEPA